MGNLGHQAARAAASKIIDIILKGLDKIISDINKKLTEKPRYVNSLILWKNTWMVRKLP